MNIIGLELNDSGILAAGGRPTGLLDLDGQARESPGFALPQKKGLLAGKTAEGKAHLFPRQILNRFWDQLNTESLVLPGKNFPRNHAEIVYQHLSIIWRQLQTHGDPVVMAIPSFYEREHLGLILGIAQELEMPVKGFVPLALAAASHNGPADMLLHLDIHLHRIELVYLEQGEYLAIRDSATTAEKGLLHLYRKVVDMIAQEFVRTTRFDPFHQAATEQELYDRLPGILSHFQHNSSMLCELVGGASTYTITLERQSIIRQAESVYREILRLIQRMQSKRGRGRESIALQLSHRLCCLPGLRERLATLKDTRIIELDRGAAARRAPEIWQQLAAQNQNAGISYFTSRPWRGRLQSGDPGHSAEMTLPSRPTHLLYRSIAYPISQTPLTIGSAQDNGPNAVTISGAAAGVSPRHCTIELRDREVILNDGSGRQTFVDDKRVDGSAPLKIGQIIRVGTPGETLQVIACLNS